MEVVSVYRMTRREERSVSEGSIQVRVTWEEVGLGAVTEEGREGGVVSVVWGEPDSETAKYDRPVVVKVQVEEDTVQVVREEDTSEKFPSASRYTVRIVPSATVDATGMERVMAVLEVSETPGIPY